MVDQSTPDPTPVRLALRRTEQLEIEWNDGEKSVYPLEYLRRMCPCAACRVIRENPRSSRSSLTVLPGTYTGPLTVRQAELVGNYALKVEWSDDHATGIYSFSYLRQISPSRSGS